MPNLPQKQTKTESTADETSSDDSDTEGNTVVTKLNTIVMAVYTYVSTTILPKLNGFISLLSINIATLKLSNEKGSLNYYFDMFFVGLFTLLYKLYIFTSQQLTIIYAKLTRQEIDTSREYPPHWGLLSFDRYSDVERLLNELNYPITVDIWVARVYGLGIILGSLFSVIGFWIGQLLSEILVEIPFNLEGIPLWVRIWAEQNVFFIVVIPFVLMMFLLGVGISYYSLKWWISYRVGEQSRLVDVIFPQGVKYQYALAESGASVKDIIYLTSKQVSSYGKFAGEMRYVVKYVEIDNMNLGDAVEKRANETRSDDVQRLLKQFAVVLESGTDPVTILRNKYDRARELKEERQETIMETQDLIVQGLLNIKAGIVFFLIIAMIMSLLGGELGTVSAMIVYIGIPLIGIMTITVLRYLKRETSIIDINIDKKYSYNPHQYAREKEIQRDLSQIPDRDIHNSSLQSKEHILSKKLLHTYRRVASILFSPIEQMKTNPLSSLLLSIPLAIVYIVFISGTAPLEVTELGMTIPLPFTIESLQPQPITAWLTQIGIPLYIALIPPAFFSELKNRRQENVFKGLSTMMVALQQASNTGQTIEEALTEQDANLNSDLQEVLRKTKNSIAWFGNLEEAIIDMNNSIKLPEFSRTTTMMIDSLSISGNITETLDVAAEDLGRSYQLKQSAKTSGKQSIVLLFFVYVLIGGILLVMLYMFFPIMETAFPESGTSELGFGGAFKIEFYTVVMVSALYNLSFIIGLIAGMFRNNNALSGLKFSIVITLITAATLLFFEYDILGMLG